MRLLFNARLLIAQTFLFALMLLGENLKAEESQCTPPKPLPEMAKACESDGRSRGIPGQFDYYSYVLSWSPAYCANTRDNSDPFQCHENRFGFVVHGLWPEKKDGNWPEYCQKDRMPLEASFVAAQMCNLPSSRLVQCEWARHGTCSGLDPDSYFSIIAKLTEQIITPDLAPIRMERSAFIVAFQKANKERMNLSAESLTPICTKNKKGTYFKEIRICLNRQFQPIPCPTTPKNICPSEFLIIH